MDENDFADPFRVLLEEDLHGVKLLRNTLDVIETVDADDEFDPLETALERLDALLDGDLLEGFVELRGLDTDREGTDGGVTASEVDLCGG